MDDTAVSLQWHSTFAILPGREATSKDLAGDKIMLPQSALEQLLSASGARATSSQFSTAATSGFGRTHSLPNPLMFYLENPATNASVYAGIREFSAPEGTIALSPYLLGALGIEDGAESELTASSTNSPGKPSHVVVSAAQLPKGTYARMRPLEAGYNPQDWRPLLERQLRQNFTSLTKDTQLLVRGAQGETFQLLVDKLLPEGQGICVVDTDLEVDIEALNEEQARETMRQIMTSAQDAQPNGNTVGGEINVWNAVSGHVLPGQYIDYVLPSWDRSRELSIFLSDLGDEDMVDLFVTPKSGKQRALPRKTEHVFGTLAQVHKGSKTLSLSPTNVELDGAESIMISVHAFEQQETGLATPIQYTIRAVFANLAPPEASDTTNDSTSDDDEQCQDCLQWIPKRSMMLHENFCRRNNVICPRCKVVFKKGSPEFELHWHCDHDDAYGSSIESRKKHDAVFHSDWSCPSCEFRTNALPDLARHRTSVCPGKLILCRFCHLEVPQEGDPFDPSPEVVLSGLTAHELADGARTTECHLCEKIIRLRDMDTHLKHHELDKVGKTKPPICRDALCGRTLHGVGSKGQIRMGPRDGNSQQNEINLCSVCFGPLYVSMHDPDGKALRRRIERRYLGQLMTGCGKAHCRNEWCKTGRSNVGLEAQGSSAQAALPLVKPLMLAVPNLEEPLFFCVDESSQTKRRIAEAIAAEKVWDLEWCIAAAESEKGDIDHMRAWLQAWAPTR